MNLNEMLERHRALYRELDGLLDGERAEEIAPGPKRETELADRGESVRAPRPIVPEQAGAREAPAAGPPPLPEDAMAVGEIAYPELPAPRAEPDEDAVERFTRVLRWSERLAAQPMEEED